MERREEGGTGKAVRLERWFGSDHAGQASGLVSKAFGRGHCGVLIYIFKGREQLPATGEAREPVKITLEVVCRVVSK